MNWKRSLPVGCIQKNHVLECFLFTKFRSPFWTRASFESGNLIENDRGAYACVLVDCLEYSVVMSR